MSPVETLPRVFLSSVIDGYASFRDAAAEGIRGARCHVVRAENFPASTTSPRTACLDGVGSADAVVLLLGHRFGYEAPSGRSVTQEEYEEAKRARKRIFVFIEDVAAREPRQEEFVRQVQDYVACLASNSACNPRTSFGRTAVSGRSPRERNTYPLK